jgi:hypothetical protein
MAKVMCNLIQLLYWRRSMHRKPTWQQARCLVSAVLAGLCLAAAAAGPARAADNKAYPGSACQRWGNSSADVAATDGGGVLNASFTSSLTVSCPIVRDNTINTNGTADVWVYVYRDGSTPDTLTCIFKGTRASDGTDFYSNSRATTQTGDVRLTIPVTSSTTPGAYNLLCILPPRSKVHAYLVPEH